MMERWRALGMPREELEELRKLGWTTDIHVGDVVRCCRFREGHWRPERRGSWSLEKEELVVCCFSRSPDSPAHNPLDDRLTTWLSDGCGDGSPLVLVRKGPGLIGPPPRGTAVPAPAHGYEKNAEALTRTESG